MARGKLRRRGARPLYEILHGAPAPPGRCRECGEPVRAPRRTWCSQRCVTNYKLRANPGFLRRAVFRRDHGRCAACGLDTLRAELDRDAAEHETLRAWWRDHDIDLDDAGKPSPSRAKNPKWKAALERALRIALTPYGLQEDWWRRTFWDAHHTTPVSHGGAYAGLAGVTTLVWGLQSAARYAIMGTWATSSHAKLVLSCRSTGSCVVNAQDVAATGDLLGVPGRSTRNVG